jgi:hypothetical protein
MMFSAYANYNKPIRPFRIRYWVKWLCWGFWCLWVRAAQAQLETSNLSLSGRVQTDLRFRPVALIAGDAWYNRVYAPVGVSRNQNLFNLHLNYDYKSIAFTVDMDFLWLGLTYQVQRLDDLYERNRIDPFRLKLHAAYMEVRDFMVAGLDIRIGQQTINWGKGDQFNPTNTINASDFEDPLLFGHQLANTMVRVDYTYSLFNWSLVCIPVFKPALLPPSTFMALANMQRVYLVEPSVRLRLLNEQLLGKDLGYPAVIGHISPALPGPTFANMQWAARMATSFFNHDLSLSYYVGRSDIPQPEMVNAELSSEGCHASEPGSCVSGLLRTHIRLMYPRMQVLGLNLAGEVPLLKFWAEHWASFGYHLELGVFLPEKVHMRIFNAPVLGNPAGEYDYGLGGAAPRVVMREAFAKWNLGLDYTLFQKVYVNAQWLHGFVDEFGAGDFIYPGNISVAAQKIAVQCDDPIRCIKVIGRSRLGDYLVLGTDARFLQDKILTRLFVVYDLGGVYEEYYDTDARRRRRRALSVFSPEGATAVLFPEVTYNAGGGLELSVGAIAKLGRYYTKFGDPAAGGTDIWTRARYSY